MARASHGLYRPQESLPAGALPFPVPFPRLARMRRTQTMFKCVRLASLRGFTAPTIYSDPPQGGGRDQQGTHMTFEVTPKLLSCRNPWWQVWGEERFDCRPCSRL